MANWDVIQGKWKQIAGEARAHWGNLTGDDWEQIGGPEEVYELPQTTFVAGFLGASNLLAGEISGPVNGRTRIQTAGGDVPRQRA